MLKYHTATEDERFEICGWAYAGKYEIYNLPPYSRLKEMKRGLGDPDKFENYCSYYDGDELIGFTNISEREREVFIGIGVRPELCGQGYGERILKIACAAAYERSPQKPVCLQVRSWNKRAVSCYMKAGFVIEGEEFEQTTPAGKGMFYRMKKV